MNYKEFFGCRYPIVAVAMNQVSDIELAIAVSRSGGFPSLSLYNYAGHVFDWDRLNQDIQRFYDSVGHGKLMLSADTGIFVNDGNRLVELVNKFNIGHIEMIGIEMHRQDRFMFEELNRVRNHLQDIGVKIILKTIVHSFMIPRWGHWDNGSRHVDAVEIKGPGGAGRVADTELTLEQSVLACRQQYPELPVIAVGGIGTKQDVKRIMDLGVLAVGVGTLFAAAKESPVSTLTKMKMIHATNADLKLIPTAFIDQQTLPLGDTFTDNTDDNNTSGLIEGVTTGTRGHIFAGRSIDNVTEILPANDIILSLVDGLGY